MKLPEVRIRERYDFYRGYWEGLMYAKNSKNPDDLDSKMRETQAKIDELKFVLNLIEEEEQAAGEASSQAAEGGWPK